MTWLYASAAGTAAAIVAVEDGTEVTIVPSADVSPGPSLPSGIRAGVPHTIVLDRYQTLQIANQDTSGSWAATSYWEDLTGTEIRASRPIAVFGSHGCTCTCSAHGTISVATPHRRRSTRQIAYSRITFQTPRSR